MVVLGVRERECEREREKERENCSTKTTVFHALDGGTG